MKSLQRRLHLGLLGSLFVLIALMWWLANASMSHITRQMMQTRLEHDGQALLAGLQQSADGKFSFKDLQVGHIYQRVYSGHYFLISSGEQVLRSTSLWDQSLDQPKLQVGQTSIQNIQGPDGQYLLQWTSSFERFQTTITITVAEDTNALISALHKFNIYFSFAAVAILVTALLIQSLIVRRSLRSLSTIKQEIQELADGDIKTLSQQVPSEIYPLVNEVNRLLKLLRKQLKRSRNSTGNLAHSLKHPLNLLMQLSESEETDLQQPIRDELKTNIKKIIQLMDNELKRAKLVGSGVPGQRFYPKDEFPGLIDVLERVYHDKKLHINYEITAGLEYPADRNDMLELLGNLLDNACKWSKGQVHCKLYSNAGLIIQIEDDGPGCDKNQLFSLTERGVRIDETTTGTGLGLAIVKDIVELYSGNISFTRSELGGLSVMVSLPLAT